jgi:hypothetical protein
MPSTRVLGRLVRLPANSCRYWYLTAGSGRVTNLILPDQNEAARTADAWGVRVMEELRARR